MHPCWTSCQTRACGAFSAVHIRRRGATAATAHPRRDRAPGLRAGCTSGARSEPAQKGRAH
eukprot:15444851-Alexandrium_andersonii.AAC.1